MTTPNSKLILDDDQKFALMKFRRNIKDVIKPHHDDQFLLRWLRARTWNVEAAEKMYRESMQWREQMDVDDGLRTWVPPEAITKHYPSGTCGIDKEGCPIYVVPIAGLDIIGLLHSASRQDLIRFPLKIIEESIDLATQRGGTGIIVIFDLEGFNLKPYTWRPATEVVISLLQIYEANYPEILKVCYVINAPKVFALAFNIIKRFLHEYTISKIKIFKSDPKKWQKALKEFIHDDQLPKHYGGTMVDPDGNPKCPSKVRQGGKVPKSYYTENLNDINNTGKEYVTTTIKKGHKLALDFTVEEEGRFLKWDFTTEEHDIRFGVTCKDVDGNVIPAVRHRRVASHQMGESGVLACKAPSTYTVTFDNSYSMMRGKKIHYSVFVTDPSSALTDTDMQIEQIVGLTQELGLDEEINEDGDALSNGDTINGNGLNQSAIAT